jgi:hypothetical protein
MTMVHETSGAGIEAAGGYGPPGGGGGYGGPPGGYGGPPGGGAPPPGGGGYGGPPPGGYGGGPPPGGYGGGPPGGGYGGPAGGGYGGPPGPGFGGPGQLPAGGPKVHPLAIVSLVAGILSVPACCCFFGFLLPIGAVACGIIALSQITKSPQVYSGKLFCYIGIGCGGLGFLMTSGFRFTGFGSEMVRRYGRRF